MLIECKIVIHLSSSGLSAVEVLITYELCCKYFSKKFVFTLYNQLCHLAQPLQAIDMACASVK